MKKKTKILLIITTVLVLLFTAILIYLNDSYKATSEVNDYLVSSDKVEVFKDKNKYYTFKPDNPKAAIIFYPGGKVESKAYAPLLFELAEEGFLTILVDFPFNLAVFDINAAKKVIDLYPEISDWYIGGHSLGGSMAASHLSKNAKKYKGLILLGSYSTVDLSKTNIKTITINGEHDKVLSLEKYNKNYKNLSNPSVRIIDGGNHANFGYYGIQKGDGTATITKDAQIKETVRFINDYLK